MSYSVLNLKADLTGVIHGTTLNKITNLNGLINRAARQLLQDVDPMETKRIAQFATPIFEEVYSYALAADVKGNKIVDIRPQLNRLPSDVFNQDYSQQFSLGQLNSLMDQFNIRWNTGIRTIQVNAPLLNTGVVVNYASSTTTNGTWTAGGNASNLTTDTQNFVAGAGSLKFDLAQTGVLSTGYLENSTMTAVNLTSSLNLAYWFLYTYLQTGTGISNVNLRFGSSSANYYSVDATLTQANTAFANGWNLLSYLWSSAVVTGTPNAGAINYLRVTWTYNGTAQTGVRLNDIACRLGQIMEYEYYSKYMFRNNSTGAFQETVLDDSDLINLDTDSYNLLFNQVAYLVAQQLQGSDALAFDADFFLQNYARDLGRYKALYKSEVQKPRQNYYNIPKPSYSRNLPMRWGGF